MAAGFEVGARVDHYSGRARGTITKVATDDDGYTCCLVEWDTISGEGLGEVFWHDTLYLRILSTLELLAEI